MILSDRIIETRIYTLVDIENSENVTSSDLWKQINPNSIDLTIGSYYKRPVKNDRLWTYGLLDIHEAEDYKSDCWDDCVAYDEYIELNPGEIILAHTREHVNLPDNICGQIFTKSTLGRMFINHMMAGVVDAGFTGKLTLELKNEGIHKIRIPVGARVVQMVLTQLDAPARKPYNLRNSRYNGAKTVECAKGEIL